MQIKQINLSEAPLVTGLFNLYRIFYKQPDNMALAESFITERLSKNESIIFVALETENGQQTPVGFTQLYPKYSSVSAQKNWILNDLYVDSGHRKKGIGEALIKAAKHFAQSDGSVYVQLETAVDNYTAQRLYEAVGFKKQGPEAEFLLYRIPLS